MRRVPIVTSQIYHIFNRGVNKNEIFFKDEDYKRFFQASIHYKTKNSKFSYEKLVLTFNDPVSLGREENEPKVQILAYSLMPNHFHFLIKQLVDDGLTSYIRQLANSYAHYVNVKYRRIGPLFQGRFKSVLIESDEQLIHVSRYIHLNPLVSDLVSDLKNYRWSSYLSYVGNYNHGLCDPKLVLDFFKSKLEYEKFVLDQEDYAKELERIKHLTFDY